MRHTNMYGHTFQKTGTPGLCCCPGTDHLAWHAGVSITCLCEHSMLMWAYHACEKVSKGLDMARTTCWHFANHASLRKIHALKDNFSDFDRCCPAYNNSWTASFVWKDRHSQTLSCRQVPNFAVNKITRNNNLNNKPDLTTHAFVNHPIQG